NTAGRFQTLSLPTDIGNQMGLTLGQTSLYALLNSDASRQGTFILKINVDTLNADTDFGTDGNVTIDARTSKTEQPVKLVETSSGNVIVAGTSIEDDIIVSGFGFFVFKLTSIGELD